MQKKTSLRADDVVVREWRPKHMWLYGVSGSYIATALHSVCIYEEGNTLLLVDVPRAMNFPSLFPNKGGFKKS